MIKIILLNGPPGCGKDTIGKKLLLIDNNYRKQIVKFAAAVKDATHRLYNIGKVPHDYCEDVKDDNLKVFYGLTPRQAYINVAELLLRPVHGKDIFGKLLTNDINQAIIDNNTILNNMFIITDSGFYEEVDPLLKEYGYDSIFLFRIFRDGTNYDNDSRGYVYRTDIKSFDIYNNGDILDPVKTILQIINSYEI